VTRRCISFARTRFNSTPAIRPPHGPPCQFREPRQILASKHRGLSGIRHLPPPGPAPGESLFAAPGSLAYGSSLCR